MPSRLRSSGTRPMPAAMAARGLESVQALPSTSTVPDVERGRRRRAARRQFGAARADQAGDAKDLAAMQVERDVADLASLRARPRTLTA